MRSSKSRSRSKSNRPRTLGNITNRVFDSSGPEGKVRGTPQQIIEKFGHLARDAQLSNDRVAAENFLQHAEHYTRMLAEAQREMQAEQDQRQSSNGHGHGGYQGGQTGQQGGGQQNGNNQGGGYAQPRDRSDGADDPNGGSRQDGNRHDAGIKDGPRQDGPRQDAIRNDAGRQDGSRQDGSRQDGGRQDGRRDRERRNDNRPDKPVDKPNDARADQRGDRRQRATNDSDVIDLSGTDDDNGLVETPEAKRPQRDRDAFDGAAPSFLQAAPQDAERDTPSVEETPPAKPRRARAPRKPKPSPESPVDMQESDKAAE